MNRPNHREVLDCGSPLPLSATRDFPSARGLAHSNTLPRQSRRLMNLMRVQFWSSDLRVTRKTAPLISKHLRLPRSWTQSRSALNREFSQSAQKLFQKFLSQPPIGPVEGVGIPVVNPQKVRAGTGGPGLKMLWAGEVRWVRAPAAGAGNRQQKLNETMKTTTLKLCMALTTAFTALWTSNIVRADVFSVTNSQDLQNALTTAAVNGADDVLVLQAGYYVGNFNFNSSEARSLTIQPAPGLTNTDVTIDSGNTSRALNLTSSTSTNLIIVRGITFLRRSGSSDTGALRISAGNSSSVVITGCRFLTPSAAAGLGLEVDAGFDLTIVDCIFIGRNQSTDRPAYLQGVSGNILVNSCHVSTNRDSFIMNSGATRTITNSTFIGNAFNDALLIVSSSGSSTIERCAFIANDGGAYVSGSSILIRRNTFANHWGGGTWPLQVGSGAQVVDNTFANNANTALLSSGNLTLLRNSFTANLRAVEHRISGSGTTYTVVSNSFIGNSRNGSGGAFYLDGSASYTVTGIVQHNTFTGNSATGSTSGGGALYISTPAGTVDIRRNVFRQNNAGRHGGAVYAAAATAVLADNLMVNNAAPSASGSGGGAWVSGSSTLRFVNNTLTQNTTGGGGGGVRVVVSNVVEVLDFHNNIIWGNSATGDGDDVYLTGTGASKRFRYNNAHDLFGVWDLADNNLDVAPQFFDPVGGDFHLQSSSPFVNAGTNGAPGISGLDLDAEPRIASGTVDMGCYEFATTAAHPADSDTNFVMTATEFTAYAAAWKAGQAWSNAPTVIPADYVTRAGYLLTNGGTYFNDGSARPVNWKPAP